ncbi:MAG: hypothetical protein IKB95_07670 [Bacteroidales bacterium]|nr:hypothetical protein [Bacteroidales bacterium]
MRLYIKVRLSKKSTKRFFDSLFFIFEKININSLWLDANSVATSSKIRDTIVIKEKFDYLYTENISQNGQVMGIKEYRASGGNKALLKEYHRKSDSLAHELGHGIAGLEHPFPESQVSGSTQNLMDYRDGEESLKMEFIEFHAVDKKWKFLLVFLSSIQESIFCSNKRRSFK